MRGRNIFEQDHVVNLVPPKSVSAGNTSVAFHMKWAPWANIIVQFGVTASAATKLIVEACSNAAGDNAEAIPFDLYKEETALGDTWSARESVTAAGYTPSANDNIMYGIFIDAARLPDDKPYVRLRTTAATASILASAIAILTGWSYAGSADGQTVLT